MIQSISFRIIISIILVCIGANPAFAQDNLDDLIEQTKQKFETVTAAGDIPPELRPLQIQLDDRLAAVRIKAVQSLSLIGSPMAALVLLPAIDDEQERDAAVRIEAAIGLGEIGGREALNVLGIGLRDTEPSVRRHTVEALRWAGTVFAFRKHFDQIETKV